MEKTCLSENPYVEEFLKELESDEASPRTIASYKPFLNRFFNECGKSLDELTCDDVHTWFEKYREGKAKRTVRLRLSTLSSLFKYCLGEGYIEKVPMKPWWKPRKPSQLPKALTRKEHAMVRKASEELGLRDRAIFNLLDATGLRRMEIVNLDVEDIDISKRIARAVVKGNKELTVDFSESTTVVLKRYLQDSGLTSGPLFRTKSGERIYPEVVYCLVKKLGKDAGLERRLYPHILRHSFATEMVSNGASLGETKKALGQNSEATTAIYAKSPSNEIASKYRRCMG